jgi:hypothetical protein
VNTRTSAHHVTFSAAIPSGMGAVQIVGCESGWILIRANVTGVATCEVLVPDQTVAGAVAYTNVAGSSPATVDVTATAAGIEVNVTKSTGACPLAVGVHGAVAGNAATYAGIKGITAVGGVEYTS